jgi:hypothetical protein
LLGATIPHGVQSIKLREKSMSTEVHTEPEEIVDDHVDVVTEAISAPLPRGSSEAPETEDSDKDEVEGATKK